MLGNFISTQAMILRLAELQDRGSMYDEHASLAKAFRTVKCCANAKPCSEMFRGFELAR